MSPTLHLYKLKAWSDDSSGPISSFVIKILASNESGGDPISMPSILRWIRLSHLDWTFQVNKNSSYLKISIGGLVANLLFSMQSQRYSIVPAITPLVKREMTSKDDIRRIFILNVFRESMRSNVSQFVPKYCDAMAWVGIAENDLVSQLVFSRCVQWNSKRMIMNTGQRQTGTQGLLIHSRVHCLKCWTQHFRQQFS